MIRGLGLMTLAGVQLLFAMLTLAATSQATAASHSVRLASAHHHSRAVADDPNLRSSSALVVDESDGSILYSKHADVAAPIASITKLMTALVIADAKLPLDESIEVTKEDRSLRKGASSRLAFGTTLTRGDLLHLALMASENRAAHALGRTYPGGLDAFVRAMNAKAKALGMTSAHFVDPVGLSSDNMASPEDLVKLVSAASHDPAIREFSTDPSFSVVIGRRRIEFRNTNSLVRNSQWDIVVQKTGYISEAGKCLVMQAVIDDRNVVMVLLNSYGRYTRVADARRIRKWMEAKVTEHTAHTVASKV
jgi:serine-type D-Ala-D-Ala endopeptidase (penicillin-binding protein 7)